MKLSAPIYRLKRQAKRAAREQGIPLYSALDQVAQRDGYRSWSHLMARNRDQQPAPRLLAQFQQGDLVLLGARPGQGKTLLGLELCRSAANAGQRAQFFSLDCSTRQIDSHLKAIAPDVAPGSPAFITDASDNICASYVVSQHGGEATARLIVIDYLQALDQRRSNPDIHTQLVELRDHAVSSGAVTVLLSQIDRRFEDDDRAMPGLADVRMPNRFDVGLFNKACFVHDGTIEMAAMGTA